MLRTTLAVLAVFTVLNGCGDDDGGGGSMCTIATEGCSCFYEQYAATGCREGLTCDDDTNTCVADEGDTDA